MPVNWPPNDFPHYVRVYDPHQAVDIYRDYAIEMQEDPKPGREKALKAIARVADEPDAAQILIKVAVAIAGSDDEHRKESDR